MVSPKAARRELPWRLEVLTISPPRPVIPFRRSEFWGKLARETIDWDVPFKTTRHGGFEKGDVAWFPEGQLNAAYNCVDRWAYKNPDKVCSSVW